MDGVKKIENAGTRVNQCVEVKLYVINLQKDTVYPPKYFLKTRTCLGFVYGNNICLGTFLILIIGYLTVRIDFFR